MNKKIVISLIVLVVIIGGIIVWVVNMPKKGQTNTETGPMLSVSAFNQTKNVDANSTPASAQDTIAFTLTAQNSTNRTISGYVIQADISQIANSSTLIDADGASYNSATNSLVWTPLDIPANQSIQKKFIVRVNSPLSNGSMRIKFNNDLTVELGSGQAVSGTSTSTPAGNFGSGSHNTSTPYKAPVTGASEDVTVVLAIVATFGAFLARKRLKLVK